MEYCNVLNNWECSTESSLIYSKASVNIRKCSIFNNNCKFSARYNSGTLNIYDSYIDSPSNVEANEIVNRIYYRILNRFAYLAEEGCEKGPPFMIENLMKRLKFTGGNCYIKELFILSLVSLTSVLNSK